MQCNVPLGKRFCQRSGWSGMDCVPVCFVGEVILVARPTVPCQGSNFECGTRQKQKLPRAASSRKKSFMLCPVGEKLGDGSSSRKNSAIWGPPGNTTARQGAVGKTILACRAPSGKNIATQGPVGKNTFSCLAPSGKNLDAVPRRKKNLETASRREKTMQYSQRPVGKNIAMRWLAKAIQFTVTG